MGQKKLKRFSELSTFPNVLEKPENMKGGWNAFMKNDNPVILELACGKGEYTIGLAALYPHQNYIGVDIKGNRMWAGAKTAIDKNYINAAFLRTHIDKIDTYFNKGEVKEIWITFPDPQLRNSRAKKRLTHPRYLELYNHILVENGPVHLKTDSPHLYNFTKNVIEFYGLEILADVDDVYNHPDVSPDLSIRTHYEKLDIAKSSRVFYLQFKLSEKLKDRQLEIDFNNSLKLTEPIVTDEYAVD